ncbi:hypothetical protein LX32DRAFT_637425 [Colletotrichum zoysiae]|uniref:Uncharacterized protein n=1 Tax=Colletotrichum zoysiae TaxID=1216348 RepID=A0AAD9HLM3_9PEZI|nr:hypothetical protein LX32DRAFT_637425 [Colletotrichum zoysiae]
MGEGRGAAAVLARPCPGETFLLPSALFVIFALKWASVLARVLQAGATSFTGLASLRRCLHQTGLAGRKCIATWCRKRQ